MVYLVVILLAVVAAETPALIVAIKRLFQYDAIFEGITPVLISYADDLRKTASSGLLEDHPEVIAFHKRNVKALQDVEAVIASVKGDRPEKPKLPKNYRPPVVE